MTICGNCGSTEMEDDNGMLVCTQCGAVVEDQKIVSEIQFQENSGGGVSALGQFVSSEGKHARIAGSRSYGQRDSRQYTLDNGRNRIQHLASTLNMSSYCSDVAYNYFKLAVSKGLTKGRKSIHVAAACLYIVCRTEKKPLMLLDFSDKLGIDVYTLGHTYLQLSKDLYITIPAIDPALYIERYAHKMEFAEKTMDVCRAATRLVSRMERDWMVQGRRPSGVCGAALLVASRIFDFNRTVQDVMRVVRIGEQTIKKRLLEFEQTPSSQLTIEEFNTINLEESMDPPCFTQAKKKAKLLELEDKGELPKLLEMTEVLREELEVQIQLMIDKKNRRFMKNDPIKELYDITTIVPSSNDLDLEISKYEDLLAGTCNHDDKKKFKSKKKRKMEKCDFENLCGDDGGGGDEDGNGGITVIKKSDGEEEVSKTKNINNKNINNKRKLNDDTDVRIKTDELGEVVGESAVVDGLVVATINHLIKDVVDGGEDVGGGGSGGESEIKNIFKTSTESQLNSVNRKSKEETPKIESRADDDFGDLEDDEEINEIILSEEEVRIKMTLWMRENADFLKLAKEKEEKKAKELLLNPEIIKKKRRSRKMKPRKEANTAEEAIAQIVQLKKLSNKINYDVLVDFKLEDIHDKPLHNVIKNNLVESGKGDDEDGGVGESGGGHSDGGDGGESAPKRTKKEVRIDTSNLPKNPKLNSSKINLDKINYNNIYSNKLKNNTISNDNYNDTNQTNDNNKSHVSNKINDTNSHIDKSINKNNIINKNSDNIKSNKNKEDEEEEEEEVDESFFFEPEESEDTMQVEEENMETYTDDWDD